MENDKSQCSHCNCVKPQEDSPAPNSVDGKCILKINSCLAKLFKLGAFLAFVLLIGIAVLSIFWPKQYGAWLSGEILLATLAVAVVIFQCFIDLHDWKGSVLKNILSVSYRCTALLVGIFVLIHRKVIVIPGGWVGPF